MATNAPNLADVERRPQRYWNADGLPELTMGVLWVTWGGALGLPELLPPGDWLRWYWMFIPLVLVGGGLAATWATKRLKERYTFPRGGYVAWPEPGPLARLAVVGIAMAVAAGVAALASLSRTEGLRFLAAPTCAMVLAAGFLVPVVRWRLTHYLILSAASLGLCFAILRLRLGLEHGMILLFLAMGVISAVLGLVRLQTYLRSHPRMDGLQA